MAEQEGQIVTQPLDPLLRALGDVERDQDDRYPRAWEDVVAGEADPAEVAAARAGVDPADEHAVFSDMFSRPTSDADIDALVARAAAVLAAPIADAPVAPVAPASDPRAPVVSLASRRRAYTVLSAALAIAAAVLLWRFTAVAPTAALGAYSVTVRNDTLQELRGDAPVAGVARYRPDSELDWVISPERATPEAIELRVLARAGDGQAELLAPAFTRSPAGALRIRGRLDATLPLAVGRWRLTFIVAPAAAAPRSAADVAPAIAQGRAIEVAPPLDLEVVPAGP